jgi:hypothetical protein
VKNRLTTCETETSGVNSREIVTSGLSVYKHLTSVIRTRNFLRSGHRTCDTLSSRHRTWKTLTNELRIRGHRFHESLKSRLNLKPWDSDECTPYLWDHDQMNQYLWKCDEWNKYLWGCEIEYKDTEDQHYTWKKSYFNKSTMTLVYGYVLHNSRRIAEKLPRRL